MSTQDEIEFINTSNIEDNVLSGVKDRELAKNLTALLSLHSHAIQFSVRTHDDSTEQHEKRKFAELQGNYERALIRAFIKFEEILNRNEMLYLKYAFSAGIFVGAILLLIVQMFI